MSTLAVRTLGVLGLGLVAWAGGPPAVSKDDAKLGFKAQEKCPIKGGKIQPKAYTDFQGQRIYFCCPGCDKKFLKEADKFFAEFAKHKILLENVQDRCPVDKDDQKVDRKVYLDWQGRRVFFHDQACKDAFAKEPGKYLAQLHTRALEDVKRRQEKEKKPEAGKGGGEEGGGCCPGGGHQGHGE